MAKAKLLTAAPTTSGFTITLAGKPGRGKIKASYFSLTDNNGESTRASSAKYSSKRTIDLSFEEEPAGSSPSILSYSPPKKDKRKGVIQSTSGKDAKPWSQEIATNKIAEENQTTETTQDPLTNAWIHNGHTYQLVTAPKSWEAARADAIIRGGYLAEVNNSTENNSIYDQLSALVGESSPRAADGGDSRYVWLGGTDQANEGQWVWSYSGESISTGRSEWGRGLLGSEPDNSFSGQDALAIGLENWPRGSSPGNGFGNAGQWNDISDNNILYYVVEFDSVIPVA